MPFVQAKCPECGGMLAVDDSKKVANCQFCGEAFIVQEAINHYNTYITTNHNYGSGSVVNIYGDTPKDFVIEAGVLKEYHGVAVDVVIPDGVVGIGENCFNDLKIKSVVIPNSVTSIGYSAFRNCDSLTSVTIGNSVKSIAHYAFCDCTSLTSITIPNSVTSIGGWAFVGCTNLTSITISDSVTSIGEYAFENTPYQRRKEVEYVAKEQARQIDWRKANNRCQHCGGTFKGLFSSKCSNCGKPKDY